MQSIALLLVLSQSLTDIQIIGSHNSYHAGLAPGEKAYWMKKDPKLASSIDYVHPPLTEQLNLGVRKFELDIFSDTRGGLFANPKGATVASDPPFDPTGKMKQPGFKVIHIQDIDYRSNCQPLKACLGEIRDWSRAHPRHLPIFIMLETKTGNPSPGKMTDPEPITADTLNALDRELLDVFDRKEILTPDDVRGSAKTLEQAVLTRGWPSLEASRGKVIFLFDQENITSLYTEGRPSLEGRVVFTNAKPGTPDAAFIKMNNPTSPRIPELVRLGYLVRTRADAEGKQQKDAALASGAQIISTDYYFSHKMADGYAVDFGGPIARCNPVRQSTACKASALVD